MTERHRKNISNRTLKGYKADVFEYLKKCINFCNPCGEAKAYLTSKGVNRMIEEDYEKETVLQNQHGLSICSMA